MRASFAERSNGQRDRAPQGQGEHDWVTLWLQIRISPDQLDTCQAAADKANLSIEAWTVLALEHAAQREPSATGEPAAM